MSYQELIENRILEVEWASKENHSNALILKEILRRYCLWANHFALGFKFFSILSLFDEAISSEYFKNAQIINHFLKYNVPHNVRFLLYDAIGWGYLLDNINEDIINSNLPHIHEPILIFYERGGTIHQDKLKNLFSYNVSFKRSNIARFYQDHPFVALDKKALDALDDLKD